MAETRRCIDLDKEIESLINEGYRLDMITPADSPREVQLSKNDEIVRLVLSPDLRRPEKSKTPPKGGTQNDKTPPEGGTKNGWIRGRAGMEYRDLIPDRLGGKLIVSHIRLSQGGEVPDYVHYHKVDFQLIYCLRARVRVVYEDQGQPFWLEPGDCVLQPPEIRHRVLEAEAGSEVLEISSPAEHETWVEHDLPLPTADKKPDRLFSGQCFVRSVDERDLPDHHRRIGFRQTGIFDATNGLANLTVAVIPQGKGCDLHVTKETTVLIYVVDGELINSTGVKTIQAGEGKVFSGNSHVLLSAVERSEFLLITLNLT